MKQIILYDTDTGQILRVICKYGDSIVLASGTGEISGGILTSADLAGVSFDSAYKFVMTLPGDKKRGAMNIEKLSDTSIDVSQWVRSSEEGSVSFMMTGLGPATPFSAAEKNDVIAEEKVVLAKDNIDALVIDSSVVISGQAWTVDVDIEELKKIEDTVIYE